MPLPPASLVQKFSASDALSQVNPEKVKAFNDKWGETLSALPRTDSAICLPSAEELSKLAMAQAEVGRSFGAPEGKAFGVYTGAVLKSSITPAKVAVPPPPFLHVAPPHSRVHATHPPGFGAPSALYAPCPPLRRLFRSSAKVRSKRWPLR